MADVEFLKKILAHTKKDMARTQSGPVQETLREQAKRLQKQIDASSPKKSKRKKRK